MFVMENFRKIVYKTPDLQAKKDNELNQETLENSERIAQKKLKKILEKNFNEFSIRYINIEEYKQILQTIDLSGEVILHGPESKPFGNVDLLYNKPSIESFQEFLKTICNPDKIWEMTNWDSSMFSSKIATEILRVIKNSQENSSGLPINERYKLIRENILDFLKNEKVGGVKINSRLNYGDKNLEILNSFLNNQNFFKEGGNLRELVNAIVYAVDNPESSSGKDKGSFGRQYQIAVVFDNKIFNFKPQLPMGGACWSLFLNMENLSDTQKKNGLLAAVSVIPTKELYQEMIEIEKNTGDFAHPVFDQKGIIRWPKKYSHESVKNDNIKTL